jgi:hypothetical protein
VDLPPSPSLEGLIARIAATRVWAHRLMQLEPGREAVRLVRSALDDLEVADRVLKQAWVGEKPPHVLRAADAILEVAQWRLRGVEQMIDDPTG